MEIDAIGENATPNANTDGRVLLEEFARFRVKAKVDGNRAISSGGLQTQLWLGAAMVPVGRRLFLLDLAVVGQILRKGLTRDQLVGLQRLAVCGGSTDETLQVIT